MSAKTKEKKIEKKQLNQSQKKSDAALGAPTSNFSVFLSVFSIFSFFF